MTTLFRDVEVGGVRVDVRMGSSAILEIAPGLPLADSKLVDGHGAALIPGLHDHHLHLLALASQIRSVDLSGARTGDEVAHLLSIAPRLDPDRWIRAVGYHESIAGDLDRWALDRLVPDRPVRVQHRSGGLWILNSSALVLISQVLDESAEVERDPAGDPTGRLFRYDDRLRRAIPAVTPDLAHVGRMLSGMGITRVTDATPDLEPSALQLITESVECRDLLQRVTLLGAPDDFVHGAIARGPRKLLLHDHALPDFDTLSGWVRRSHESGRPVAVHCVTRESLILTLVVLDEVGSIPGDRIEHGAVVPADVYPTMRRLGVAVVTQPDFLRTRGDAYLREVAPDDVPCLYPFASLTAAGIPVCASSDAPFGPVDPWQIVRSARDRLSESGASIGTADRTSVREALTGYWARAPGGTQRSITIGAPSDVVLLHVPLATALAEPSSDLVRDTYPD